MTLLSIVVAFIWDYFHTLERPSFVERRLVAYAEWVLEHFDAGTREHALLAWTAGALLPGLAVGVVGMLLGDVATLLAVAWGAVVVYYCTGYRRVAEAVVEVQDALRRADLERARQVLAGLGAPLAEAEDSSALARLAIAEVFRLALAQLFGVLFWFAVLGPFASVVYVLSRMLSERWPGDSDFNVTLARITHVLDWVPSRLMALSFAIVGNFEAAMESWRARAEHWGDGNEGVVLAAGNGALGMRPGEMRSRDDGTDVEAGAGSPAGPDEVAAALGLVWRMVLLWLGVLGLLWLGSL